MELGSLLIFCCLSPPSFSSYSFVSLSFSFSLSPFFSFLSSQISASLCDGPEISLYNNQTATVNGTEVVNGTFAVCQDGTLIGFCDDGSIDDGAAQMFCNALGYLSKL